MSETLHQYCINVLVPVAVVPMANFFAASMPDAPEFDGSMFTNAVGFSIDGVEPITHRSVEFFTVQENKDIVQQFADGGTPQILIDALITSGQATNEAESVAIADSVRGSFTFRISDRSIGGTLIEWVESQGLYYVHEDF